MDVYSVCKWCDPTGVKRFKEIFEFDKLKHQCVVLKFCVVTLNTVLNKGLR